MRTVISHTIRFGREHEARQFQLSGWSDPEPRHNWSIGKESVLLLPELHAPDGFFIEVACGPHRTQRLSIDVNETLVGSFQFSTAGTFAWRAPPVSGPVTIRFRHPDALRPCDVGNSQDSRELAVSFRLMRILTLVDDPPSPHDTSVPDALAELALRFESLGDNCELGVLQRWMGADPLGLLRFSSGPIEYILNGLDSGFEGITEGLEAYVTRESAAEWSMHAPRYAMRWHTFIPPDDVPEQTMLQKERLRLGFLVRKLMQDMADGEKVFVVKRADPLPECEVMPLFLALRRLGNATMLWMSADPARAGEVDVVHPGLLAGYVSRFGDPANIDGTMRTDEWVAVMRQALARRNDLPVPRPAVAEAPKAPQPDPPGSWPLKTIVSQEITFGAQGNARSFQAYGWSDPEGAFTWTSGTECALVIDPPDAPFGYFLELDLGFLTAPARLPHQRLAIHVDGRLVRSLILQDGAPLAIYCPPCTRTQRRLIIRFDTPDAARPSDLFGSPDTRQLAVAFHQLRVLVLTEALLAAPGVLSAIPFQGDDLAKLLDYAARETGVPLIEWLTRFEMLSGSCEMGFVQRVLGIEPLSLLRFAGASPRVAIRALDSDFEQVGKSISVEPDRDQRVEWMISDAFGLYYHTGRMVADHAGDDVLRDERRKIAFLRRKLLEDLAEPRKIFVFEDKQGLAVEYALPLLLALRRHAAHNLLWVTPAESANRGSVQRVLPGLYRGGLDRQMPPVRSDNPTTGWLAIFFNAWRLIVQGR